MLPPRFISDHTTVYCWIYALTLRSTAGDESCCDWSAIRAIQFCRSGLDVSGGGAT